MLQCRQFSNQWKCLVTIRNTHVKYKCLNFKGKVVVVKVKDFSKDRQTDLRPNKHTNINIQKTCMLNTLIYCYNYCYCVCLSQYNDIVPTTPSLNDIFSQYILNSKTLFTAIEINRLISGGNTNTFCQ